MSLFGKVLAILNVLAAIAFVALASMDWAKRHAWSYAVFRHDLVINGLPVDETEADPVGNAPIAEQLTEATLQEVFRPAGGQPVSTQRAEVKRLQDSLRGKIQGAADEKAQRQALYDTVLPLARTTGEREELSQRVFDEKVSMSELMGDFDGLFQTGSEGARRGFGATLLPGDERQAIAHLLFGLQPDPGAFARVQVVVGLKEFNDEAGRQANALRRMSDQVRAVKVQERGAFAQQYEALAGDVRERADTLTDRRFFLAQQQKQLVEHKELLESRRTERQEVEGQIEAERARHKKLLGEQAGEEKVIFEAQEQFRKAKEENERLEREIRKIEQTGAEAKK